MIHDITQIFRNNLYECDQHVDKMCRAQQYLCEIMPLDMVKYSQLTDVQTSFIDQLIFRFSKLQNSMGEKIFPMILLLTKENVKKKTFLDMLNRLEELEVINKLEWLELREVRNEIAHEYSFNVAQVVESIMAVYQKSERLVVIYQYVRDYCVRILQ